jgi:replicative DNA helicase
MDVERALIAKAVQTGQVERLISMGVEEDHFADPEVRQVFAISVRHLRQFKTPPSMEAMRKALDETELQGYTFDVASDSLEYLAVEFIKQVKRRATIHAIRDIAKVVDEQPQEHSELDAIFLEKARELSRLVPSTRIARLSEVDQRIAAYNALVESGEPPGIPMGIPVFDALTQGVRKHEFISIAGWQGTGKSTLLLHIFFHAYLLGKTPLIVSLEMEAEAILRKVDVMATNFEYTAMKALKLGEGDLRKWEEWGERAQNAKNDIIILDDLGRCTVDKIYAETVRYAPDMVGVDYVSLMDAPRFQATWEKVTYLTRELKMNARNLGIPVFAVAQTNINSAQDGAQLENIAYSRSIGQDSDAVIGLWSDERMQAMNKMELRLLKNRDGKPGKTWMYWEPERMVFREWTPDDMWRERAALEEENKK